MRTSMLTNGFNLTQALKRIVYFGTKYVCPVCDSSLRTLKTMPAVKPRLNALCPVCNSLERHRLQWKFFKDRTNLFSGDKLSLLHIAPESCFSRVFSQSNSIDYLTADIMDFAMVKMDITNIQYPDNYFDIILCSHVLEHIEDDKKAMSELSRVLNPNGWAILQVPILVDKTYEDFAILDPVEREQKFGQSDHVRIYGPDYRQRLEESGFTVDVISFLDTFNIADRTKYGFSTEKDDIYFCKSLP